MSTCRVAVGVSGESVEPCSEEGRAATHFVTPPLKSGKPYVNPPLPWPLPGLNPNGTALDGKGPNGTEADEMNRDETGGVWSADAEPPVPDEAACLELWTQYAMLPHIGRHSRVVADMAEALARRAAEVGAPPPETVALARAAGLLHDIAKTYCVRYGGSHAQIGASWVVAATGHRRLAQAVYHHVEWPWPLPENMAFGPLAPLFFVLYADKRAKHDALAGVEERYADLMIRYGKTEHSRTAIARGREHVLTIERVLSAQLEFPLHESTLAGGRLVKRA